MLSPGLDNRHKTFREKQYSRNWVNSQMVGSLLMTGMAREDIAKRLGFSEWRVSILERKFWRERSIYLAQSQVQALSQSESISVELT